MDRPPAPCPDDTTEASPDAILLRTHQAAALCGISVRTWRTLDATGKVPRAIRLGRATFWRPEELKAWVASRLKHASATRS
jgi:predicted DNA-binding transcriptional regulator AlpA